MKQNIIKKLTDREHILLKPSMYIGGISEVTKEILQYQDGKFIYKEVTYNPGFLKIFDEILDNSIDEAIRTNFKFATNIKISYNKKKNEFIIDDDGRGIPQTIAHDGLPSAVVAFTEARAGSNFTDEKANGIGTNGIGSFLTNVYSTKFIVKTSDSKSELTLVSVNNAESFSFDIKPAAKQGTSVAFIPDLSKFNMTEITDVYFSLIENRCFHLAQSFPEIKFKLQLGE
jgi:DNA gyrase/topoisomerase IV subunit B